MLRWIGIQPVEKHDFAAFEPAGRRGSSYGVAATAKPAA